MEKDILSLEYIADSDRLANYGVIYARIMTYPIVVT
jgi:hypothetical protein